MASENHKDWVVLKFGGSSVSSASNWHNIVGVLRDRLAAKLRPVVVHSALSGVTDQLDALLSAAQRGEHTAILDRIERDHRDLARQLAIVPDARFDAFILDLKRMANAIAETRELSDRIRARVMSMGELLATALGSSFLNAQGIHTTWADARHWLRAEERHGSNDRAGFLSATCDFAPDAQLQAAWGDLAPMVIITQGFIAANDHGDTVLLGRGGSDTSGAYFAAKLAAVRFEIWTDVPGLFSANPRLVPTARLLRALHYDEAQEIASNGAKILHPRCILPVRQYKIPLHVYATQAPGLEGTIVSANVADSAAQLKAIAIKKGITLISMESPGMWHQVGFLADAFQVFKQLGLSVDLVSTSETNVTVSLDPAANTLGAAALERLNAALGELCRVEILGPCASLSLLGHNIRGILHELGSAFELFQDHKIYLVTQAANDLNFTFVIDELQGDRLVRQLHERLIQSIGSDKVLGPTWQQLFATKERAPVAANWWEDAQKRHCLCDIATRESAAFVYDGATLDAAIAAVQRVGSVERWAYAMKANWHPDILRRVHAAGLMLECVSQGELEHAFACVPGLKPQDVLFTPNFAPRAEYEFGLSLGVWVTLDNQYPLKMWPELFRDREIFLRIDPGVGRGHHHHVRTAGVHSKFGVPINEADELEAAVRTAGARVVGLHAHTGSGIFDVANWTETGVLLADLARRFPEVCVVDLGGGLGVPEQLAQAEIDLAALDAGVAELRRKFPSLRFWMEPGRFLVAKAGVLVAVVTQLKGKGDVRYVGIATGMNSLIRPALYGSHHDIRNLTRLGEPQSECVNVVGPICETADLLGADRWLPPTVEGDVLLIATCGAYGRAMASNYNRRPPAAEFMI
jgi:diaminopimelate decarboxylase/aspartate kinase